MINLRHRRDGISSMEVPFLALVRYLIRGIYDVTFISLRKQKGGPRRSPPGDTILVLLKDVERPVADQPVAEILTIVALDPTRNAVDDSD